MQQVYNVCIVGLGVAAMTSTLTIGGYFKLAE